MSIFKRTLIIVLTIVLATLSLTFPAYAISGSEKSSLESFLVENIDESWAKDLLTDNINKGCIHSYSITANGTTYYIKEKYCDLSADTGNEHEKFYSKIEDKWNRANLLISDSLNPLKRHDVGANTEKAVKSTEDYIPIINNILGIIIVMVTVGLAVFTTLDVCYIVFPPVRDFFEDALINQKPGLTKKKADGGVKLRFVSAEAQYAVKVSSIENGNSPLTAYLKMKVFAYIVVSVVIFILLTGNISIISNLAAGIVSKIIKVISNL